MRPGTHILFLTALAFGCNASQPAPPLDLRATFLNAAAHADPEFPDGKNVILTHFAHLGDLTTADGQIIHVADQRAVIAGMLAPRGQNRIVFFDANHKFLGNVPYVSSRPLWCDGPRLYLFGNLDGFPRPGRPSLARGNVIDVSDGYSNIKAYHLHAYGSSGGIEDTQTQAPRPTQ